MARASAPPEAVSTLAPDALLDGARALGLSLAPSHAERLMRFAALLMRWSAIHNLTAIRSPAEVITHHLLDSLAIVPPIDRIVGENRFAFLDVGAGGGLPGIPLAIARPEWNVTLVDKVQKKVAFLTQAQLELQLSNVECVHARVEELQQRSFDVVLSRAFSTLEAFVRVSRHLIAPAGCWAAMKGALPKAELAELSRAFPDVRVVDVVKLAVPRLEAERHLVLLQSP